MKTKTLFIYLLCLNGWLLMGQSTGSSQSLLIQAEKEVKKIENNGMTVLHVEIGLMRSEMTEISLIRDLHLGVEYYVYAFSDPNEVHDIDLRLEGKPETETKYLVQVADRDKNHTARFWYDPTANMGKYYAIKVSGYNSGGERISGKFCVIIARTN